MNTPTLPPTTPLGLPRPPGPPATAMLTELRALQRGPVEYFGSLAQRFGPVARTRIGHERIVVVSDPAAVHDLLVRQQGLLHKDRITNLLRRSLGEGLLTSEGDFWRKQRKTMAPLFRRKQLAAWVDEMVLTSEALVATLADGQAVDAHALWMKLTLDIVFETVFGAEDGLRSVTAGGTRPDEIGAAINDLMALFERELRTWRRFAPDWLKPNHVAAVERAAHALDAGIMPLIERRRREAASAGDEGTRDDLVSRLLSARADDGSAMDDRQIRDEAVTMFVAGHETTAIALSYLVMRLSAAPEVHERLLDELDEVLGDERATAASLERLPYTRATILESLRLDPPAWIIGREALEDLEVAGTRIERGEQILMSAYLMQRDPRHFDDPLAFRPERWLTDPPLERTLPPGVYFPFGGGPRVCIGQHFAMLELLAVLATVLRRVRFDVPAERPDERAPSVTMRPIGGMAATVRRR
jgi:cytochrome P450